MKKLVAIAVSAIMLTAMIPSTIFAKTDNYINKVVTTTKDTILTEENAPTFTITNEKIVLVKFLMNLFNDPSLCNSIILS